jgi:HAD superfamily hydrolase (TIGR01509 family)
MSDPCLVLDFDGTILETEEPQYRAWAELWGEYGHELSVTEWQRHIGNLDSFDPRAELERRIGRKIEASRHVELRRRRAELQALTGLRPGIEEWLSDARAMGLSVGIASSSPREWVEPHLDRLGLRSRFACVVCSDAEIRSKPAPDSYLSACSLMDADPHLSVAVEDSPHGVQAAATAGLFVLAVPHGLTSALDLSAADVILRSLQEMALGDALGRAAGRTRVNR